MKQVEELDVVFIDRSKNRTKKYLHKCMMIVTEVRKDGVSGIIFNQGPAGFIDHFASNGTFEKTPMKVVVYPEP